MKAIAFIPLFLFPTAPPISHFLQQIAQKLSLIHIWFDSIAFPKPIPPYASPNNCRTPTEKIGTNVSSIRHTSSRT